MLEILHLFLYSYDFLFQIHSNSSTDFRAKGRARDSEILSPIQCCDMYLPVGGLHLYKALAPGVINVLNHAIWV
jgi:hypothetical protein